MGLPPTSSSRLGLPSQESPRLTERTVPDRIVPTNHSADTTQALRLRAIDRTAPEDPVKPGMDDFRHPKSPYDAIKGRIPTPARIDAFVNEHGPTDTTGRKPPTAHRYTFDPDSNRMKAEGAAPTGLRKEPAEIINALFQPNVADLDQAVLRQIMADCPLLLRLESFLEQTNWQGTVEFVDTIPQGVQVESNYIGLNKYHLDADWRDGEDVDLHQALRDIFQMTPGNKLDATSQQRIRAERIIEKVFDSEDLANLDKTHVDQIKNDLPLLLKLEMFLAKTKNHGDVVFRDVETPELSYHSRAISLPDYHLEADPKVNSEHNVHDALRVAFNMPLKGDHTMAAPDQNKDGALSDTNLGTANPVQEGPETEATIVPLPAGETRTTASSRSDTEDVQIANTEFTAIKELWEDRAERNSKPVYPPK